MNTFIFLLKSIPHLCFVSLSSLIMGRIRDYPRCYGSRSGSSWIALDSLQRVIIFCRPALPSSFSSLLPFSSLLLLSTRKRTRGARSLLIILGYIGENRVEIRILKHFDWCFMFEIFRTIESDWTISLFLSHTLTSFPSIWCFLSYVHSSISVLAFIYLVWDTIVVRTSPQSASHYL